MSSDEFPRAPEGSGALDDDPAADGTDDAPAGKKARKAKGPKPPKAAKSAKEPKPPKEPKKPKAAKEPKASKPAKGPKSPKPAKEPKVAKRATTGDDSDAPKGRRGRRAAKGAVPDDPASDAAGPDEDIGWTAATESTPDHSIGPNEEPAGTDDPQGDGDDGPPEPTTGSRKRLVGAVAIGPLLLIAALFLPTDRGRHGSAATAAPTSVPAATDDGADETPIEEAPADTTPRFLVLIEQDLPPTTTVAATTTTSTTIARRATTRTTAGDAASGETGETGETPHEAPEPTPATAPPIVVNTIANEDTQLAVFLLTDGRRVEMAVPVRYFSLVPAGDPAQHTFDKEVAGHLLVRDRDGRYWGGDLDSEPALLYQLPSSKVIEPGPTTTAAPHAATTTTEAAHAEPTGTTTTTETHAAAEDHAATTAAAEGAGAAEAPAITIGTGEIKGDVAEGGATGAVTTTTEYVREPFPLVVQGAVSVEDERVVRLLAALPGVASVLDLGRGAVIVSGDIDRQAILDVPGVLSAQPTSAS